MEEYYKKYYLYNLIYNLLINAKEVYAYKSEYTVNGYIQESILYSILLKCYISKAISPCFIHSFFLINSEISKVNNAGKMKCIKAICRITTLLDDELIIVS